MNFDIKNFRQDLVLTLLGIVLSLLVVVVVLFLVIKERATLEQAGGFLGIVLPAIIGIFGLAGRIKNE